MYLNVQKHILEMVKQVYVIVVMINVKYVKEIKIIVQNVKENFGLYKNLLNALVNVILKLINLLMNLIISYVKYVVLNVKSVKKKPLIVRNVIQLDNIYILTLVLTVIIHALLVMEVYILIKKYLI